MDTCCDFIEPCATDECSGYEEIQRLLPKGRLWDMERTSVVARHFRALAHVKTELNKAICREWGEIDPQTSNRFFSFYTEIYSLPSCVDQTPEKLAEWVTLISDPECPIGTVGFLKKAVEFVAPEKGIQIQINKPDIFGLEWGQTSPVADENMMVVTAPPECYFYEFFGDTACFEQSIQPYEILQDGINDDRRYFIPEIECLRSCVFPFGMTLGYKTLNDPVSEFDIAGVPLANQANKPMTIRRC